MLLYDTDNREQTQAYDCIFYDGRGFDDNINPETTQSVQYCIRSDESILINRNYSQGCLNDGILISFEELKQSNISIDELLKWNSGVNVVHRYQFYLE